MVPRNFTFLSLLLPQQYNKRKKYLILKSVSPIL